MVTYAQILKAVNGLLKDTYPEIGRYGNDTKDALKMPYFFVEIVPLGGYYETKHYYNEKCSVKITYRQPVVDQPDQLEKCEGIRKMLGMKLNVQDRKLNVTEFGIDYIGEDNDILQISFRVDHIDRIEIKDDHDMIQIVETEIVNRKES